MNQQVRIKKQIFLLLTEIQFENVVEGTKRQNKKHFPIEQFYVVFSENIRH